MAQTRSRFGWHRSRGVVLKLSRLFGLDAFAGGFVVQSIVAYWFHVRFGVSQMDVPPRQSYTMVLVAPDERSAAAGITGIVRSVGAAISPTLAGLLLSNPRSLGAPFFVAGGLKIIYDILLYRGFRSVKDQEI
jgi:MFS family permease